MSTAKTRLVARMFRARKELDLAAAEIEALDSDVDGPEAVSTEVDEVRARVAALEYRVQAIERTQD